MFNIPRVSDNSPFAENRDQFGSGFRLYNQYAVFVYSQLQNILPDSYLGDISNWEKYLSIDLNQPDLPYKTANEFVLNSDFHRLVTTSKLPRPSKFVEQTISFFKSFCSILLSHEIIKSDLIRGLACFDSAVILHGSEGQYLTAVECLTTHFFSLGWVSPSEKTRAISQYRSLVSKFRESNVGQKDDWFHFLVSHYELQCRPELHQLFKLSSLCLPPLIQIPPSFKVPIPELGNDEEAFSSCVESIQISFSTVPNVSSLYQDPRSVPRVFRLLGRGKELLADRKFSIWNILKRSGPKRASLFAKFDNAYKKAVVSPEVPILADDGDVTCGSGNTTSTSSPSPHSNL